MLAKGALVITVCSVAVLASLHGEFGINGEAGTRPSVTCTAMSAHEEGMQRWLADITYLHPTSWSSWDTHDEGQLGLDSYRYPLAFLGYTFASIAEELTPAYSELASDVLKNVFDRLLDKRVWEFWGQKQKYGLSYCETNLRLGAHWCPDPVFYEVRKYDNTRGFTRQPAWLSWGNEDKGRTN
uniref:Linalool dehydratase/isomerase domain-containing protein n=1 Tax=Palpitomonas bilix TaxID=652834 RepID=A0A7S3GFR5_9EUKA|mmetsp:Transcript_47500/g.123002  ORF Transcript_47500/g.123002 Transcript_47500/m.123002 type:complete len:183 (+) Transcript_47500:281-829(+)